MAVLDGFTGWPQEFADRYRARGYWRDRPLGTVLRDSARTWPDRVALVDGERRWTYRELDAWADRVAAGLRGRGIADGDRVLVHLPNVAEFVPLCFALFRIGVVPVLALPPHRDTEITHLARLASAVAYVIPDVWAGFDHRPSARALRQRVPAVRHVIVVGDAAEFTAFGELDRPAATAGEAGSEPGPDDVVLSGSGPGDVALSGPRPDDVALLLLSGGTTGPPKLIPRTHNDYEYNLRASARVAGLGPDDRYLAALPVAHNFALACPGVLGTLATGGTVVLAPSGDPETAFTLIERERVTVTALVPPLALMWLDAAEALGPDLRGLRLLQVGGSRLKAASARRVRPVLGCALQQVYGMAEGLLNFTRVDDPDDVVCETQGRPLAADDEVRIVDAAGRPVPPGEAGELQVRGPYTLRGYFGAGEDVRAHNATAFTPDGFYRTGDLVRRLPGGELVVEGRVKDVINRGGDKIPAEDVEGLLMTHPAVRDVALVGIPDEVMGERSCAYVIPRGEPPTRRDLVRHLTDLGVAAYKFPDRVRIVDDFPRTPLGKIDKRALAQRDRSPGTA
ncbi:AMP-binding protein [Thermopolyspora sp. NPDC052614]|uniref:(2,3-dihydroxybenzoyl)adenylate synthase n=1 Tax=Thermopolyspora sp. NPDC052614 TaxID=3155682 RepID=UPI0034307F6B